MLSSKMPIRNLFMFMHYQENHLLQEKLLEPLCCLCDIWQIILLQKVWGVGELANLDLCGTHFRSSHETKNLSLTGSPGSDVSPLHVWTKLVPFSLHLFTSTHPLLSHSISLITLPSLSLSLSAVKCVIDAGPPSGRLLQALCSAPLILAVAGDNFITAQLCACLVCLLQTGCCVCVCVCLYWELAFFPPGLFLHGGFGVNILSQCSDCSSCNTRSIMQ